MKKRLTNTPDLLYNVYHEDKRITSRLNSTDSETQSASHQTHKMHLATQESQQVNQEKVHLKNQADKTKKMKSEIWKNYRFDLLTDRKNAAALQC